MMTPNRLEILLSRYAGLSIMVVGDFFLDKYLVLDPALDEPSLETGLAAHQVVDRRCMPGAAGTVAANLRALGVGRLHALGITGDDGEGYELRQGLAGMGIHPEGLIESPDRFTPTYIKPMLRSRVRSREGEEESSRMDIQNRSPTPRKLEDRFIDRLRDMAPGMDGVAVLDQVGVRNTGVVTDRVREAIGDLGRTHPDLVILADSRARIGEFRHVIRKGNREEMRGAARGSGSGVQDGSAPTGEIGKSEVRDGRSDHGEHREANRVQASNWGQVLYDSGKKVGESPARPVYVTLGADGLLLIDGEGSRHVPGIRVQGPVDTVGAGDSVTAGIVASLAVGASLAEAGMVGNLAASITVRQLGVTGTASPGQLMDALATMNRNRKVG